MLLADGLSWHIILSSGWMLELMCDLKTSSPSVRNWMFCHFAISICMIYSTTSSENLCFRDIKILWYCFRDDVWIWYLKFCWHHHFNFPFVPVPGYTFPSSAAAPMSLANAPYSRIKRQLGPQALPFMSALVLIGISHWVSQDSFQWSGGCIPPFWE